MDKREPSEWEKIITNETTDKGLIPKIYKQLIQQKNKQPNQKVGKRPNRHFSKEDIYIWPIGIGKDAQYH